MSLVDHARKAIEAAYHESSLLTRDVLDVKGLSTNRIRHLINNICHEPVLAYLEVGTWLGSTLISARYGNDLLKCVGIDNYSEEFEGVKPEMIRELLHQNVERTLGSLNSVTILESDCFNVRFLNQLMEYSQDRFQAYLYDGAHDEESQYKGIKLYAPLLAKQSIIMVDDWDLANTGNARRGTARAIQDLGMKVLQNWELPAKDGFHEGFYVAVVEK